MAPEMRTSTRFPDLWFDLWARLMPGVAFVALLRFFVLDHAWLPSIRGLLATLAAGYFIGFLTQPASAWLAVQVQDRLARSKGRDQGAGYWRSVCRARGRGDDDSRTLRRMHGEIVAFIQIAVLSLLLLVCAAASQLEATYLWPPAALVLLGVCVGFACLRADAQLRQAIDCDPGSGERPERARRRRRKAAPAKAAKTVRRKRR